MDGRDRRGGRNGARGRVWSGVRADPFKVYLVGEEDLWYAVNDSIASSDVSLLQWNSLASEVDGVVDDAHQQEAVRQSQDGAALGEGGGILRGIGNVIEHQLLGLPEVLRLQQTLQSTIWEQVEGIVGWCKYCA